MSVALPTEPIGSIPRPPELIAAIADRGGADPSLEPLYEEAVADTLRRFEETGSPVVTDGEQRKVHGFWTYGVEGLPNAAPAGFRIPFGRSEARMPRLTGGPFRYARYADSFLDHALRRAGRPVKQAVISASAMSFLYPPEDLPEYRREEFVDDLVREHETEIRRCLARGADSVQIDFCEARLAARIDPSGELLRSFVDLGNIALERFSAAERRRIGVHVCPGGGADAGEGDEIEYADLLPSLFELKVGRFFVAFAGERARRRVLETVRDCMGVDQQVFVGVVSPDDPRIESAEEVCERTLEAAESVPVARLGTTDDCGFSPFSDRPSASRDVAFAKIRARVEGTAMASRILARRS